MTAMHPREQLHELLDGRLDAAAAAEVELHLRECAACRAELAALRAVKDVLRAMADEPIPAPAAPARRPLLAWGAAAAAVLAVIALVAWLVRDRAEADLASAALDAWRTVDSRPAVLEIRSSSAAELEQFFRGRALPFEARVFDLAMMGWQLEGARLHEVAGRRTSLWSYRSADGRLLVCLMFLGEMGELPEPDQRIEHEGRPFHVFRRAGRTIVFWPEGRVLCALVGEGNATEVIELAKAKAMGALP